MRPTKHIGVALAPYYLPQEELLFADLIRKLGESIVMFYAWQHGTECHGKLPKKQELLQMPGRDGLDFALMLAALKDIEYAGWTEIFMHAVPRGISILDSTAAVIAEINRSRNDLSKLLSQVSWSTGSLRLF